MIEEVLPAIRAEHTVTFCDVFCEKGVFSLEQSERLLRAARHHRFKLKMHADEIVPFGGAELAASLKCVSADHLLHISDTGIKRLARAGVVATLLPLTAFSLNEPYAPARKMIDAGCAVALASVRVLFIFQLAAIMVRIEFSHERNLWIRPSLSHIQSINERVFSGILIIPVPLARLPEPERFIQMDGGRVADPHFKHSL